MKLFGWKKKETGAAEFVSPAGGRLIPITEVEDETFSSKMLGDGFAVDLTDGTVAAPFDGEITAAFPTGHAFGLKRSDGLECLIHIGMDTVELQGKGFDIKARQGDHVSKGQALVVVDLNGVRAEGKSLVTPVIFPGGQSISLVKSGTVARGEEGVITFA